MKMMSKHAYSVTIVKLGCKLFNYMHLCVSLLTTHAFGMALLTMHMSTKFVMSSFMFHK